MQQSSRKQKLFELADQQQGYFTAKQAIASGYTANNHHLHIKNGEWVREGRGIYRLAAYPMTERPDMMYWALWSRDRSDKPTGVFSHATALALYNLSDVMPAKLEMTVPPGFRRSGPIPRVLRFIRRQLPDEDKRYTMGFYVTTPLRSLIDVIEEGRLSRELIQQAVSQAVSRGLVKSRREFFEHPHVKENPQLQEEIKRYVD